MAAVTTRFAACEYAPGGNHYWVGPVSGSKGYKMTHPSGAALGTPHCSFCGVLITDAVTIPICPECGLDAPAHKPKCKTGRAT